MFLLKSLSFWEQNTNRCVDEVQEVLLTLVAVKQRGCLGLHCYPPLSLHLKLVQHLLVLLSLCYGTCLTSISPSLLIISLTDNKIQLCVCGSGWERERPFHIYAINIHLDNIRMTANGTQLFTTHPNISNYLYHYVFTTVVQILL